MILKNIPGLATAAMPSQATVTPYGYCGNHASIRDVYTTTKLISGEKHWILSQKDGTVCHVVENGKRCVAATSNDTVTMLQARCGG